MSPRLIASLAAMTVVTAACQPPTLPPPEEQRAASYVIDDVTVIDVERGVAVPARTVRIAGDRIADILDANAPPSPAERFRSAYHIDGRGRFLMPGLFDAH